MKSMWYITGVRTWHSSQGVHNC